MGCELKTTGKRYEVTDGFVWAVSITTTASALPRGGVRLADTRRLNSYIKERFKKARKGDSPYNVHAQEILA